MHSKLSRRDFIINSSVAAVAVPAFLKTDLAKALDATKGENLTLQDYLNRFAVSESDIQAVIQEGLSKGGDYCDVYFEHTIFNYIGLEDKAVNRAYANIDFGVGIRVLKGDQTGYSFTEEITPKAMKLAAQTAANIASAKSATQTQAFSLNQIPNYYQIKTPWESVSVDQKIPFLEKINDAVFAEDSRVIKCNVHFSNQTSYVLMATSEGKMAFDYRPMLSVTTSVTAEEDGKRENNYSSLAGRYGIEVLTPQMMDALVKEGVHKTTELFKAVKPDAGEMEVVLAAGSSGILLHEAIGHGMEADFNRKKTSIFSDKMDKPVAEKFVTIIDDGTNPNARGALNVDDEANETGVTYLVKDGILRSYLHDRISAQYYDVKPTGNGRRQSFRYAPLPRMRSTYMAPGPHKKEEIIKSVKKGLFAESFTNGEVRIGPGDFTFYVKSGYLIEDGKLTEPVKDINIIGNGPDVLSKINMVADDFKLDSRQWTCGKDGQGVPVSLGLPTVKVSSITVGGKNV